MPTSEYYRLKAEKSRILAKQTAEPREREMLLRLADQWDPLAEHKAKREPGQGAQNSN